MDCSIFGLFTFVSFFVFNSSSDVEVLLVLLPLLQLQCVVGGVSLLAAMMMN